MKTFVLLALVAALTACASSPPTGPRPYECVDGYLTNTFKGQHRWPVRDEKGDPIACFINWNK